MKYSNDIKVKIKKLEPEIQNLIGELEAEVAQLQKLNAKLEVKCMSQDKRIEYMKKEFKNQEPKIIFQTSMPMPKPLPKEFDYTSDT